jgi:serine/threonine-protein kinase
MTWVTGQKLQNGKYIIQQVLGQGGFGITYKALQVYLNRPVVIKTPNEYLNHDPEYDKYIERFIAEGQTLARLSQDPHPHIVGVIELFQEGNTHCLVMEFVPGENLFQAVKRRGALPEAEIITYIRQIGAALIMIHEAGLVHRDAHPGNIMLRSNGRAVLIDFGIAKQIIPATQSSTNKAAHDGFAPYEQIGRGSREPTVDVYCLAATLYYAVTAQYPKDSLARKFDYQDYKNDPLIPPQEIIPTISDRLNQAILNGMALEAKDRPQSMQAWLEMLNNKHEIPNVGKNAINAERENVNTAINIVFAPETINNVEKNNPRVKVENPIVISPPLVRDTHKKEVVYPKPERYKKTINNKPARTIPWVQLTIVLTTVVLLPYFLISYLTLSNFSVDIGVFWAVLVGVGVLWAGAGAVAGAFDAWVWIVGVAWFVIWGWSLLLWALGLAWAAWAGHELEKSFSKFHTFLILTSTSNIGLGLGWIVYRLFKPVR